MEELFQHSNKQVKIHGSPSSCLTCSLLPLRHVTHYTTPRSSETAAANSREKMTFSFYLNKTSAAPDLKNPQESVDDVTPWTWSTASMNLPLWPMKPSDLLQMHRNARTVPPSQHPATASLNLVEFYCSTYLMPTVANLTPQNFLLGKEKKLLTDSVQEQLFLTSQAYNL